MANASGGRYARANSNPAATCKAKPKMHVGIPDIAVESLCDPVAASLGDPLGATELGWGSNWFIRLPAKRRISGLSNAPASSPARLAGDERPREPQSACTTH